MTAIVILNQLSTTTTAFMARSPARQIRQQQQQHQQRVCLIRNNDRRINLSSSRKNTIIGDGDDNGNGSSISAENNIDEDDDVMLLPVLEADLARLKSSSSAATTKDEEGLQVLDDVIQELEEKISAAKMAAEFGIRMAQSEFYDAFSNQNLQKMKNVWSLSDDVSIVHPGMGKLQGNDAVMQSWNQIFMGFRSSTSSSSDDVKNDGDDDDEDDDDTNSLFRIEPSRVDINICGRTAICSCVEEVNGAKLEALNIYRREDGKWRMTMHMASPRIM